MDTSHGMQRTVFLVFVMLPLGIKLNLHNFLCMYFNRDRNLLSSTCVCITMYLAMKTDFLAIEKNSVVGSGFYL